MRAAPQQSRFWFGTIWLDEDITYVQGLKYKYIIISDLDHTEEEQEHRHCLIEFNNPRRRPATQTAHWEKPVDIVRSRQYCIDKGPEFYENGNLEVRCQNKDEWTGFVDLCKTATPKELIESPFSKLFARYQGFAGTVHNQFANLNVLQGDLKNYWLVGQPGTGKTKWAWDNYPDLYVKDLNKWWDGYHGQDAVLLDDWDPRQNILTQKLKIWADRYPFRAETKGGSLMARPSTIIVTSNYSIEDCFENPADVLAIRRRFKVIHFRRLGDPPSEDDS